MRLSHTPQFDEALRLMHDGGPFTFITGRAGTGKSTLLKHFRSTTKLAAPVLAPTGVAALNVNGETIHRFFGFAPGITTKEARRKGTTPEDPKLWSSIDMIVIDEISMVRADLLDCMNQFLKAVRKNKQPFGGLRIVAIGDLYQLPPVVTTDERAAFSELYDSPYFFGAQVVKDLLRAGLMSFIELEKVYRQTDPTFISLLNAVRTRNVTGADLKQLNQRVRPAPSENAIVLTSINATADNLNEQRLKKLPGKIRTFQGEFQEGFPQREAPTEAELRLKKGARVMCIANDPEGRFVNGSLGWVTGFANTDAQVKKTKRTTKDTEDDAPAEPTVTVTLDDGRLVSLTPHTWTVYRSVFDRKTRTLSQERVGSFTQIPLKLAWAVTIHKSQGKTFDHVVVDLGTGAFASGQTYVALSRCRTFEGLSLKRPVRLQDIRLDPSVHRFTTALEAGVPGYELIQEELF